MTLTTRELLTQLIDLTPPPPIDDRGDVDALLEAFEAIIGRRTALFERVAPPLELTDADRPLVQELERRDAAWQAALTAALHAVGEQRHATGQLRAYAAVI